MTKVTEDLARMHRRRCHAALLARTQAHQIYRPGGTIGNTSIGYFEKMLFDTNPVIDRQYQYRKFLCAMRGDVVILSQLK